MHHDNFGDRSETLHSRYISWVNYYTDYRRGNSGVKNLQIYFGWCIYLCISHCDILNVGDSDSVIRMAVILFAWR